MLSLEFRVVIVLLCIGAISAALLTAFDPQGRQPEDHGICTSSAGPGRTRRPRDQGAGRGVAGKVAVVYYGWLIDEHGQPNTAAYQLAAGRPDLIIVAGYTEQPRANNLPAAVRALFHASHTRIAVYIATQYGQRPLSEIESAIADSVANADAIFLDEVTPAFDAQSGPYYATIAAQVRSAGKIVIANPGVAAIDERIMDIADIVMLEHQWTQFVTGCGWYGDYPLDRFMGVSSNEPGARRELGHMIDAQQAVVDTRRAWDLGIGWHYSCDRYTDVPPWYDTYMRAIRSQGWRQGAGHE